MKALILTPRGHRTSKIILPLREITLVEDWNSSEMRGRGGSRIFTRRTHTLEPLEVRESVQYIINAISHPTL